jgi:hypothetical protein
MFSGRKIAIATMHQKETVVAPLLKSELNLLGFVPDIDTDIFGTFCGAKLRSDTAYTAALNKCNYAMDITGCDIAIASEGSFGPHPEIFFAPANEELVLLVDRKNKQEFFGKVLTTDTNYSGKTISSIQSAFDFVDTIGFSNHAVIIKDKEKQFNEVHKGIDNQPELIRVLSNMFESYSSVWIETDMRAMYNPTRMKTIENATLNLIEKIKSKCPNCNFPGFWIVDVAKGLPCSSCNLPTKSTKAFVYECKNCHYVLSREFPNNKSFENPMYCGFCNP